MCFGLVTTVVSVVSSSEEDELPSDEVSSTVFVSFFLSFLRSPDVLRDALLSPLRGALRLSRRRVLVCFSYNLKSLLTSPSESELANNIFCSLVLVLRSLDLFFLSFKQLFFSEAVFDPCAFEPPEVLRSPFLLVFAVW